MYVKPEDEVLFDSFNEAILEKNNLKLMQPENYYRIVPVYEEDDDYDASNSS
jgi:hypothetical protein